MSGDPKYQMTVSLNVLRHLGLGLYSNVAAVLSEVVANSWDADAEHVWISINAPEGRVVIEDNGHGMTVEDANRKYLYVGYERRNDAPLTPRFGRAVMGRKGIGKLSLFSIAQTVRVESVAGGQRHGFVMDAVDIEEKIRDGGEGQYEPLPVATSEIDLGRGTRITLTDMKRQLQWTGRALRRRLARRFSIIGQEHRFAITLDDHPITATDRDYQDKVQYIWTFGDLGNGVAATASNLEQQEERSGELEGHPDWVIDGWIGTASMAGQLIDTETSESINKLVVLVRGKLAQEDILEEFGEGGLYTKYMLGEIHADFLDMDDAEDIATTSRQKLIEEDPRYQALREKLREELKHVQSQWTNLRRSQGTARAVIYPGIKEWFTELDPDQKVAARRLFGRINELPIEDESNRRQLIVSGVLAFESLKLRNMLHRLDEISTKNLDVLQQVFVQLDDLEASAYYQIAKERLRIIRKLTALVDEDAKERAIQEHLYKHLWLLDPSWERATHTEHMERSIMTALDEVCNTLTEEQKRARVDVKYSTNGNKHVIIELKRAGKRISSTALNEQVSKYYTAAEKILSDAGRSNEPVEIVVVVGRRLSDWDETPDSENRFREMLAASRARVVMYDELINNALQAYQDYVDGAEEAGRVYRLVHSISEQDIEALSPTA
ncbi:MAG: ATP-binding protein [Caldilineaceae bacterium]|nr:ATP-binding protein [Caldilineaceae bacterium]MDE0500873.1 ATP-binding protein [bacterium]